jgi:hypothetical protein
MPPKRAPPPAPIAPPLNVLCCWLDIPAHPEMKIATITASCLIDLMDYLLIYWQASSV